MKEHILLPQVPLQPGYLHPAHEPYLRDWRERAVQNADDGDIAASICLQAALIDLVLYGEVKHDWLGVMDEFLMDGGAPLAYSEAFGRRLYGFGQQFRQSTVHAIHTRWWLESQSGEGTDHGHFAELVLAKRQTDGLIYDRDVSPTILRHRMKTELTMSMAMAAEILQVAGKLVGSLPLTLATDLVAPAKVPLLGYISMEYFRLAALRLLGHGNLFPVGIEGHINACAEHLAVGWCDFALTSKVDAFMGTAKRTERDRPIHSPLIATYVAVLIDRVEDAAMRASFANRLTDYACHLRRHPMDIPAFQMRDVAVRFGEDRTPIEVICASFLASKCES